ncbi:unnamed protein product [Brugia timori]|uniref:Uncharacterized protein n=1 Tax=Brugia timori TaxID=42155 RepID=A0A3P7ZBT9_9BILA|nr:unnamed protein product [Brugia timori]
MKHCASFVSFDQICCTSFLLLTNRKRFFLLVCSNWA